MVNIFRIVPSKNYPQKHGYLHKEPYYERVEITNIAPCYRCTRPRAKVVHVSDKHLGLITVLDTRWAVGLR